MGTLSVFCGVRSLRSRTFAVDEKTKREGKGRKGKRERERERERESESGELQSPT